MMASPSVGFACAQGSPVLGAFGFFAFFYNRHFAGMTRYTAIGTRHALSLQKCVLIILKTADF